MSTGCGRCPFCQQFPVNSATRFERDLSTARAQLAERDADVNRLQTPYDEIMKEANKRWEELFAFHKGMINDKDSELARLRADTERRLLVIRELVAIHDAPLTPCVEPRERYFRAIHAWDAARREGKDHPGKYCQYCRKAGHTDAECHCTRPVDWKPNAQT